LIVVKVRIGIWRNLSIKLLLIYMTALLNWRFGFLKSKNSDLKDQNMEIPAVFDQFWNLKYSLFLLLPTKIQLRVEVCGMTHENQNKVSFCWHLWTTLVHFEELSVKIVIEKVVGEISLEATFYTLSGLRSQR
jgi:hypothetical protein